MFIWILPVASPLARFTLKRYFLFPLPFAKSGRETGLTKWLCAPGNRPTETPERIWAVTDVPSATFSADADSKEEEDLFKVLVAEDPLAPLESDWWIDWKNQVKVKQSIMLHVALNWVFKFKVMTDTCIWSNETNNNHVLSRSVRDEEMHLISLARTFVHFSSED